MLSDHNIRRIRYSAIKSHLGNRKLIFSPNAQINEPLPLIPVQSALKCEDGHISLRQTSIIDSKCPRPDCYARLWTSVPVQQVGKQIVEVPSQQSSDQPVVPLDHRLLASYALGASDDTQLAEPETRSSNIIDRIVSRLDVIFPPDFWTVDKIKVRMLPLL